MDFLFRHPRWKGRAHEVLIPVKEVFCGDSTARSPEGARLVSAALRFIAANRLRDISPADVVAHLGCNRRFAERHLRETCGKTMRQAIEEARMEEARRRLVEGESVGAVVRDMRFTSVNQFYRIYKRHFGHTTRGGEGTGGTLGAATARRRGSRPE